MRILNELAYDHEYVRETTTEPDPDGSDRGGFHQLDESVKVEGDTLIHEYSQTEGYEERFEEIPEPIVENKEDAIRWLLSRAKDCEEAARSLRQLAEKVKLTTKFVTDYEAPEKGDESDEE